MIATTERTRTEHKESNDLINETVALWQERAGRQLTREDGRQITENMTGFFRVLREWDRAERAVKITQTTP
jgi:hypothetical protein